MTAALIRCKRCSVEERGEPSGHQSRPLPSNFCFQSLNNFHNFFFSLFYLFSLELIVSSHKTIFRLVFKQNIHFVAIIFQQKAANPLNPRHFVLIKTHQIFISQTREFFHVSDILIFCSCTNSAAVKFSILF